MILSLVAQVSNSSNASMNIPPYYIGQARIFSFFSGYVNEARWGPYGPVGYQPLYLQLLLKIYFLIWSLIIKSYKVLLGLASAIWIKSRLERDEHHMKSRTSYD